jgi:hypothetical protein
VILVTYLFDCCVDGHKDYPIIEKEALGVCSELLDFLCETNCASPAIIAAPMHVPFIAHGIYHESTYINSSLYVMLNNGSNKDVCPISVLCQWHRQSVHAAVIVIHTFTSDSNYGFAWLPFNSRERGVTFRMLSLSFHPNAAAPN